jgi:uncharacterized membrane protein YhhN
MFLVISCLAWFLNGIGEGGGEAPIAGMAIGMVLMIWTAVAGFVNAIKRHKKHSRTD